MAEALQAGAALHLPHAHERRFSNNHSRAKATTINTAIKLDGADEAGFESEFDTGASWASDALAIGFMNGFTEAAPDAGMTTLDGGILVEPVKPNGSFASHESDRINRPLGSL